MGQSIALGFAPLLDSMEAIQHLGDAVALLPLNELTIGLQHFRDATVREPEGPPEVEFGQYLQDLVWNASSYWSLSYIPQAPNVEEDLSTREIERLESGDLDEVQIVPRGLHEYMIETFGGEGPPAGMLETDNYRLFTYDGHISCNLLVIADTVVIENAQVDGIQDATVIESQNGVVREWALDVIERYREESEEFTAEDLPE